MANQSELKHQIQESFKKLGFEPRGNQEQIVYDVLDAFLNKNN